MRDEQLRTYRVARIRDVVLLEHGFSRSAQFDLPTYWRERVESFTTHAPAYECTVRIHLDAMQIVKRVVPGRYRQVESPDGAGWSTVRFRLETPDMARMLVLGLRDRAQVLEPSELQESVLRTARDHCQAHARGFTPVRTRLEVSKFNAVRRAFSRRPVELVD